MRSTDRGTHKEGGSCDTTDARTEGATAVSVLVAAVEEMLDRRGCSNIKDAGTEGVTVVSAILIFTGEDTLDRRADIVRGAAGETLELVPGKYTGRERLAGVDADERPDMHFFLRVAGYSLVSTKLGGDEVAGTADDARGGGRTETSTVGDAGPDVNMVEVATDVSDVDVVTNVNKFAVVADVGKVDEVTDVDPET